jgi:hypothetical protein
MMRERRWKEKESMMRMRSTVERKESMMRSGEVEGKEVYDEDEKYCREKRSQ